MAGEVAGYDDGVTLSEHEQEALARLAAGLNDPWLSYQLIGTHAPPSRSLPSGVWVPRWVGPIFLVLGVLLTFVTFARWLWVGGAGVFLIAFGGWLLWQDRSDRWHPASL